MIGQKWNWVGRSRILGDQNDDRQWVVLSSRRPLQISRPGTVTSLGFSPLVGDDQADGAHIVTKDGSVVARYGSSRKDQQACVSAKGTFAPTTTPQVDPMTSELSSFFDVRKRWPGRDDQRLRHAEAGPRTRASAETLFRLAFISGA